MIQFDPKRPKWEQVADVIQRRIETGEYEANRLLSEVKLEAEFEVARITMRKAMARLRDEGWIVTTPGMGSFVVPRS